MPDETVIPWELKCERCGKWSVLEFAAEPGFALARPQSVKCVTPNCIQHWEMAAPGRLISVKQSMPATKLAE